MCDIFKPGDFKQSSFVISGACKSPAAALWHPAGQVATHSCKPSSLFKEHNGNGSLDLR